MELKQTEEEKESWKGDADKVMDGIKETTVQKYVKNRNQVILRFTTNGKTWAWSILNNYTDKTDNINNYAIRDPVGNGVFTEKYPANEYFSLPAYAK